MAANTTPNSTNVSLPKDGDDVSWTAAFSIQFFVSIVGNFLILLIIYRDNRLKTTTNYLVVNMAVSDLIAALLVFPNQIVTLNSENAWFIRGGMGAVICKLSAFAVNVCFIVSINSCVCIAIDRYYAVAHTLSRCFHRKIKRIIVGIWIWTSILSSPTLFYFGPGATNDKNCTISTKNFSSYKVFAYFILVVAFSLPLLLIITAYTLTIYKLYRHKAPGLCNVALQRREQQNKKVFKMGVTIVAFLYICNGSWLIYNILLLDRNLHHIYLPSVRRAFAFLLYMSLCYNFFIYVIFNDIYRERIKTMMSKCCCGFRLTNAISSHTLARPTVIEMNTVS